MMRPRIRTALTLLAVAGLALLAAPEAAAQLKKARVFDLQPLSDQKLDRLSEQARQQYLMGLKAVDHINYRQAIEYFQQAVEAEPSNDYLRFILVQAAYYMGDTRYGNESVRYYEIAVINLEAIAASDRLNNRERARAERALSLMRQLRDSVAERDDARMAEGRAIAEEYAQIAYEENREDEEGAGAADETEAGD